MPSFTLPVRPVFLAVAFSVLSLTLSSALPPSARAELRPAELERIVAVARELGDLAVVPGPLAENPRDPATSDPQAIERGFAGEAMADVVVNVLADSGTAAPEDVGNAVAAAVAAAPALEPVIVARVARAYPDRAEEIREAAQLAGRALEEPAPSPAPAATQALAAEPSPAEPAPGEQATGGDQYAEIEAALYEEEGVNGTAGDDLPDPIEPLNRFLFAINELVDTVVLRPAAALYGFVAPQEVKTAMSHFFRNLNEPIVIANKLLQGEGGAALDSLGRFAVNTTVGGAGFFEVAEGWGLPPQEADFGQTLQVWGVGHGPYLVLPLLGPNSLRHGVGRGVDSVMHPRTWVLPSEVNMGLTAGNVVVIREALLEPMEQLRISSLDYYTALKSAYWQNRKKFLAGEQGAADFSLGDGAAGEAFESFE